MFEFEDSKGKIFEIDDDDLVQAWNEYCDEGCDPDSEVFFNDEDFLDMFSKTEIAEKISWGSFALTDAYVTLDRLANFKTSDDVLELIDEDNIDDDFLDNYCEEYAKVE